MSEYSSEEESAYFADERPALEDLPPVRPPSAGFILQLFLVPALIVVVVIGVWALFGKMAAGEEDWRKQLGELRSDNVHRRWRGANGLAQLIAADAQRGARSEQLTANREIASELAGFLKSELDSSSQTDDDLKRQTFLMLTLARMSVPDVALPVLQAAAQPSRSGEIRGKALEAIAVIVWNMSEAKTPIGDPQLEKELLAATHDATPAIRQRGAYALALLQTPTAAHRLTVLLDDADAMTRLNAAIGLARSNSTAGLSVFKAVLADAAKQKEAAPTPPDSAEQAPGRSLEKHTAVVNTVAALSKLADKLTPEESKEVATLLAPIAADYPETKIRLDAGVLLKTLEAK
jgi:hypothetical protein